MSHDLSHLRIQTAILSEAKKEWKYYLLGISSMVLAVQANLTNPILIRLVIDNVIVGGDSSHLLLYTLGIVGLSLLAGILNYGNRWFNDKGAELTTYRMRNQLFEKIQNQSLKYLQEQETGQLMTRATADLAIIKQYLRREFRLGLDGVYYFVAIGIIIYFTRPSFLLVLFILLPFLLVISWISANRTRPLFEKRRQYFGVISDKIQENISAIETIRAFNMEETEIEKFEEVNQNYLDMYMKAQVVQQLTLPIAVLMVSLGSVFVLFYGGIEIMSGSNSITLGMLVQMNLYLLQLVTPTRLLGNFLVGYTRTNVSGKRVFEILWSYNDIEEPENAVFPESLEGKIEFDNVSFAYENDQTILNSINLIIEPKQTLAIFGSAGSGKSTLINMIPRFYDPTSGVVKIDGFDVRTLKLEPLRRNVAAVSQDVFLFSRSIRDNISFGRPDATDEEIEYVAKIAKAHDFIIKLPKGYKSIIGERGITLSGGQKQRLTIARALLMNPAILILDDSTSSVDAETEFAIQEALETLLDHQTTLIITQKISSARFADMIIVIDNGKIIEQGTHDELMKIDGFYKQIYLTQKDPALEEELAIIRRSHNE